MIWAQLLRAWLYVRWLFTTDRRNWGPNPDEALRLADAEAQASARIDPAAPCPACGHGGATIRAVRVDNEVVIQRACQVCGAMWHVDVVNQEDKAALWPAETVHPPCPFCAHHKSKAVAVTTEQGAQVRYKCEVCGGGWHTATAMPNPPQNLWGAERYNGPLSVSKSELQ